ncbi:PREDICTED: homeobox protein ATH1-like isoform X2 [Populus euphratica]|uniref:Homeobox protein ATH1-like isoform X2 n=1 Tax=Populus euphratica TaxID=75702 RepID=A0AAJ6X8W2_POPEU|nr:PREDICTED: homeobox protein ATH1-like isoform X2 [Populus euphratica]
MENGLFSVPIDMAGRNSVTMDCSSQRTPNSLVQLDSFNLNHHNQTSAGFTMLPTLQGEPISDLHANIHSANQSSFMNSDALVASLGRNVVGDTLPGCSRSAGNPPFQEQFGGGIPNYALATLVATRSGLQETLNNLAISGPSSYPLEVSRSFVSNDCTNALNSSFASSLNYGCGEVFGSTNGKEDFDRFPAPIELGGRTPLRAGFQPHSSVGNLQPNGWITSNGVNVSADECFASGKLTNELSLSLATSQPSVMDSRSIPDQSSEITLNHVARHFSKETRYLHVIQEILAQIASYSLENLDQGFKTGASTLFSSSYIMEGGFPLMGFYKSPDGNDRLDVQMDPALQKRALEAKRTQLLTLLQLVDERYSQCLDEIHTVISAFHAATELDPQIHTRFSLQTISFLYKRLRERISNQILAMGAHLDSGNTIETEGSFGTSYLQKQWTLQQLKKNDHQLWRPQRGLPERSVSVLRAWMFQNFLHPYPKDAEKHLLAAKSGLTRSQVSNWFINARVRLWKPMIEEMYAEMNRRKAHQNEEGTNSNHRISISAIQDLM